MHLHGARPAGRAGAEAPRRLCWIGWIGLDFGPVGRARDGTRLAGSVIACSPAAGEAGGNPLQTVRWVVRALLRRCPFESHRRLPTRIPTARWNIASMNAVTRSCSCGRRSPLWRLCTLNLKVVRARHRWPMLQSALVCCRLQRAHRHCVFSPNQQRNLLYCRRPAFGQGPSRRRIILGTHARRSIHGERSSVARSQLVRKLSPGSHCRTRTATPGFERGCGSAFPSLPSTSC